MQTGAREDGMVDHQRGGLERLRTIAGRPLTRREQEIVRLLLRGETNRGIAAELGISEHTVKVQLGGLYAKVGVKSRLELAMKALRR